MGVRYGTYIREPDGATNLYHSPSALWNDPQMAFRNWREYKTLAGSMGHWRRVDNEDELTAVENAIGHWLNPGEYWETPGTPADPTERG